MGAEKPPGPSMSFGSAGERYIFSASSLVWPEEPSALSFHTARMHKEAENPTMAVGGGIGRVEAGRHKERHNIAVPRCVN